MTDELQRAKVGDELHGQVVEMILGQSAGVIVYTTKDKHLRWNYKANGGRVPTALVPAVTQFDTLMTEIVTTVPTRHKRTAFMQLGKALFAALEVEHPDGAGAAFNGVKTFVTTCAVHTARFRYVSAFLGAAVVLAASCLVSSFVLKSSPDVAVLLTAAASGVAGSAMSVLYRSQRLALDPTAHTGFLVLQGVARALLGALFGVFIVLACKGELILGFAKDHPLALYPLAIVAGFSERFVPEIMSHLENTP